MICNSCGSNIKSDFRFCPNCGQRIVTAFADHYGDLQPPYVISPVNPVEDTLDDIPLPGDVQYPRTEEPPVPDEPLPRCDDTDSYSAPPAYEEVASAPEEDDAVDSDADEDYEEARGDVTGAAPAYKLPDYDLSEYDLPDELPEEDFQEDSFSAGGPFSYGTSPADPQMPNGFDFPEPPPRFAQADKPYFVYNPDPPPSSADFFVPQAEPVVRQEPAAVTDAPDDNIAPAKSGPAMLTKLLVILLMVSLGSIMAYIGYGLAMGYLLWPPYLPF